MKALLHSLLGVVLCTSAAAQTASSSEASQMESFLEVSSMPLWEGASAQAQNATGPDAPTLTVFRPHFHTGNGTAVVVAPGGAYLGLAANLEGRQVADWFAARGVIAFLLKYRLGPTHLYPTPLLDAQRAIRLVRANARKFGVAPNRIGMIGFSAGGHLTAMTAVSSDDGNAASADPVERVSSRVDFMILGYPWLNAMEENPPGVLSYCSAEKLTPEACASYRQYSPVLRVTSKTPPAFIYHTTDDTVVPVDAAVRFYRALAAAGVSAEMHIFASGSHGSGLGLGNAALDQWTVLLEAWMRARGLLTPDAEAIAALTIGGSIPKRAPGHLSIESSLADLLKDPATRAVLVKDWGTAATAMPEAFRDGSIRNMAQFPPVDIDETMLTAIDRDLESLAAKH